MTALMPINSGRGFFGRTIEDIMLDGFFNSFQCNIYETPIGYELEIAVPGMNKKQLKLQVADGVLTVKGKKESARQVWGLRQLTEFETTTLHRSFVLPSDADEDKIKATCRDGVLYLTIGKKAGAVKKQVPIEVTTDKTKGLGWKNTIIKPFVMLGNKLKSIRTK